MNCEMPLVLAQQGGGGGGGALISALIGLLIFVAIFVGCWKAFAKAGKPGWGVIIPIYNWILALEIAGRPIWWIFLLLIPVVNLIVAIIVCLDFAKNFGKGAGFGIGLFFLLPIFLPILGFGSAQYQSVPH